MLKRTADGFNCVNVHHDLSIQLSYEKKIKEAYRLIKDFLSNNIKKLLEVEVQESEPLSEISLFQSKVRFPHAPNVVKKKS